MKELGLRIAEARKNKKISQRELAQKIGIAKSTISGYEAGLRKPDPDTLLKIANALDVSVDYLLGNNIRWVDTLPPDLQGFVVNPENNEYIRAATLKEYLKAVEDIPADKPIFVSVYDNQLTRSQIRKRLKEYAKKAGITGVRTSPHTFRHTFAKFYLLNGGDMFTLQKILGHETLDMVKQYVSIFSGDIKEQHRKYSPLDSLVKKKRTL